MRHEQISHRDGPCEIDIAAVWPSATLVSPIPVPETTEPATRPDFLPTPAAADLPAGAWMLLVGSYLALISAFALAAAGSAESVFVITIAVLFIIMFFAVPRAIFRIEPKAQAPRRFDVFLRDGIDTLTGRCGGTAALVQMLIVPVLLTVGALAMAVTAALIF